MTKKDIINLKKNIQLLESLTQKKVMLKEYDDFDIDDDDFDEDGNYLENEDDDWDGTWDEEDTFKGHTIKTRLVDDGDVKGEIDGISFYMSHTLQRGADPIPNYSIDDISVECENKKLGRLVQQWEYIQQTK